MHDSLTAVTRQKKALGEELQTSRQELDRLASLLTKIGKEKEELARGKAELAVACTAFESENRQQAEIIAGGDYSIQQSCRRMLITTWENSLRSLDEDVHLLKKYQVGLGFVLSRTSSDVSPRL